ncbi:hypothetical protein DFJ74DRAFT_696085 [Hyaloraphidium curvatum]|nr:hypothetical protein DFJ74DRAFT_696085 [Hyaloraphidium curvatum]
MGGGVAAPVSSADTDDWHIFGRAAMFLALSNRFLFLALCDESFARLFVLFGRRWPTITSEVGRLHRSAPRPNRTVVPQRSRDTMSSPAPSTPAPASDPLALHLLRLLRYQRWLLGLVIEKLAPVSDTDYFSDCGLVFRSIHGVLNHVVATLRLWGGRLAGHEEGHAALHDMWERMEDPYSKVKGKKNGWETYVADRAATAAMLLEEADKVLAFANGNLAGLLASGKPVEYTDSAGGTATKPANEIVAHMVNHSTYHVGQITVGFRSLGRYGDMDGFDMSYFKDE